MQTNKGIPSRPLIRALDEYGKKNGTGRGKSLISLLEGILDTPEELETPDKADKNKVKLELIKTSDPIYKEYRKNHYIPSRGVVGQQLQYLIFYDSKVVGLIGGASAVLRSKDRDKYLGLSTDETIKTKQLNSVINNNIFKLDYAAPNLATIVLKMWRKQIIKDWENLYGVPDGGFFAYENTQKNHKNNNKFTRIGINIAKDMNDIRFPEKSINYEEYLMEMKKFLILISKDIKNLEIMFFPHIWSDMNIIGDLLSILPDEIRREKTIVSELCCFKKHKDTIFKDYLKCDYILATRFHSNIISLSNHIPTIAMINCNQIRGLCREIGLENYTLDVRKINFSEEGILKFKDLKNNNIFKEQIHIKMNYIINQLEEFKTSLNSWLKIVNLKKL